MVELAGFVEWVKPVGQVAEQAAEWAVERAVEMIAG